MKRAFSLVPLLAVLVTTIAAAQGTFYRTADGKWKPLKTTAAGSVTKFSLSPQDIGGGSTLVVVNKPSWMVLDDEQAPAVLKILLDGQECKAEQLALGQVTKAPGELVFAVKDDRNPLDLAALRVVLNGTTVPAARVTATKLGADGKSARIAIKLGELAPAKYLLAAELSDLSPARNSCALQLAFSTAPLIANGSFEEADNTGKPLAWSPGSWGSDDQTTYEWSVKPGGAVGDKALLVKSTRGGNLVCSQSIDPLKPGATYVYSGQYKTEGGCSLSVITYDRNGKEVDYLSQGLPAAKDWTPFTWELQVKPHEKATVVVRTGSKGETWFDGVELREK